MSLRDVPTVRLKLNMVLTYQKYSLNAPPRGRMGHLLLWWVECDACMLKGVRIHFNNQRAEHKYWS